MSRSGRLFRKWLILEALVLTAPALGFMFVNSFFAIGMTLLGIVGLAMGSGDLSMFLLLGVSLPFFSGAFWILSIWLYAMALHGGDEPRLTVWFVVAAMGGLLATGFVVAVRGLPVGLGVALPAWLLTAHLLYLRYWDGPSGGIPEGGGRGD